MTSEKMKMTIPVTQVNKNNTSVMQFYLPSKFSKKTVEPKITFPSLFN